MLLLSLFFAPHPCRLSDLVSFRHFVTEKFNLTLSNTWICFGGSYPGSLAAWFRLKVGGWGCSSWVGVLAVLISSRV